jgi:hypothetical protein
MPKAFDDAVKKGAKIRTKELPNGKYMHIAILNGKTYPGEIKKKKGK